jgi:polynucleotide 5'-kinase involved in rRNA processing
MIVECQKFKIPYLVVDANKPVEKQLEIILKYMKDEKIEIKKSRKPIEIPIKYANTIAIGGMIAAGKSTLTQAIALEND